MRVCAFILHLPRATARRQNAHDLLATCGVEGEVWPAVDGGAMPATDRDARVGTRLFDPAYPFTLKPGEIGCFLGHRAIWAELQTRDADAALVIEDDAALEHETFAQALGLARAHVGRLGYIQFQTRDCTGKQAPIDAAGPCRLVVPEIGGLRTTAQMVGKRAAAHLLALSETIDRPVDTFVQSHWHTGLRPAAITPSGVSDIADRLDGSTIQGGGKRLSEKLRRELRRARYRRAVARHARHSVAPVKGGFDG